MANMMVNSASSAARKCQRCEVVLNAAIYFLDALGGEAECYFLPECIVSTIILITTADHPITNYDGLHPMLQWVS